MLFFFNKFKVQQIVMVGEGNILAEKPDQCQKIDYLQLIQLLEKYFIAYKQLTKK